MLQSLGHSVEESHPAALDESLSIMEPFVAVISGHTAMVLDQLGTLVGRKVTAKDVEPWTWFLAEQGFGLSASSYLSAIQVLQILSRQFMQWWADEFDLLLIPTLASPPPLLGTLVVTRDTTCRGSAASARSQPVLRFFQHKRAARYLSTAFLELIEFADWRPIGGGLWPRGLAHPSCRTTRTGAAVEGSPAAGLRVSCGLGGNRHALRD